MLELFWLLMASIPLVTGLAFVLLAFRQRWQRAPVPERVKADRR